VSPICRNPGYLKPKPTKTKDKYRVTNWPEYNCALVRRGDITVWFKEDFLRQHWRGQSTGKRGAPLIYSDAATQVLLMLKAVFSLPYRSVEGLACSLMRLMGLKLPVPDHTQISRRASRLPVVISRKERQEPLHWVVDSTGLKIYAEAGSRYFCERFFRASCSKNQQKLRDR
jgi:hypothetical protein